MEKYRVYVGEIQGISNKIKYSCCDPTMARMLVFSSRKPDGSFRVMTIREESTLSEIERSWLSQVRFCVAMENTSQSAQQVAKSLNELMDVLEKELQREKEALTNGGREENEYQRETNE